MEIERNDVKTRGPIIVEILRDNLANTALVQERPFQQSDIVETRQALLLAAPYVHPKVFPDYWDHIVYSSILARHIARKVGSNTLSPYEAESLQLIDDIGSLVVPHRYFRKNVAGRLVSRNIGVRQSLAAKHPPIPEILGRGQAVMTIDNLTLPQAILDLSDNMGKLNPDGTPLSITQIQGLYESQASRYTGGVFASERFGLRALTQGSKQQLAIDLIFDEIKLLANAGVSDINEVLRAAFTEFSLAENQDYLRALKQAQETLDLAVDRVLGKPPIQTVVFDIGGVLTNFADDALWQAMALALKCSPEEISTAISQSLDDGMPGKISKEHYLRRFFATLGLHFPSSMEEAEGYFNHPEVYYPTPGMPELVGKILGNPNISVFVLSDAIPPLVNPNLDIVTRFYPGIKRGNILISSVIGAAKREKDSPAFEFLFDQLGHPNLQSVLFIDDNANYSTAFRAEYGGRAMHFRENDPERLIREFKLARIA